VDTKYDPHDYLAFSLTLNVEHRITKEPLSLFFIDLEPKENNTGIYDME
jgi:hypothetical protein